MMMLYEWLALIPNPLGVLALIVGITALVVAMKNYRRKSGLLIRGSFISAQSIECNDRYVSKIILENMKDRSVTIYCVYLRLGHNYFIELESFEDKPLILKPYETYHQDFGPIDFYELNGNRFNLNQLFENKKIKKRLALSTGDGKYVVPRPIEKWNPISDFFRNYWTVVLHPITTTYKGKYIGSNVKFVIEFASKEKEDEIVLLRSDDYKFSKFKNFRLTSESLESKEKLENFLLQQIALGKLVEIKYQVFDASEWRRRFDKYYDKDEIIAEYYSWIKYTLLGRIHTWLSNRELHKENIEPPQK